MITGRNGIVQPFFLDRKGHLLLMAGMRKIKVIPDSCYLLFFTPVDAYMFRLSSYLREIKWWRQWDYS